MTTEDRLEEAESIIAMLMIKVTTIEQQLENLPGIQNAAYAAFCRTHPEALDDIEKLNKILRNDIVKPPGMK